MIVTIIIPCRNEENFIKDCLQSVQNFILPENLETEILVIDGMSTDNTREILQSIASKDKKIKILDNPKMYQVSALNIGIENSKGDLILRLDAHAKYPSDYLLKLYSSWMENRCDCVGGVIETHAGARSFEADIVQAVTTHPFGVGNSSFRTSHSSGFRDTVPYGLFPKKVFLTIGKYNEQLISGEDYEMSARIRLNGGKIWQNGRVVIQYYNQPTLVKFYRKQFEREGHYNVYMWYLAPYTFALRHALPGLFAAGVLGGVVLSCLSSLIFYIFLSVMLLYGALAVFSSLQQSFRYKNYALFPVLPFCFFGFHFLYGLGILSGMLKVSLRIAPVSKK